MKKIVTWHHQQEDLSLSHLVQLVAFILYASWAAAHLVWLVAGFFAMLGSRSRWYKKVGDWEESFAQNL
jgi:hypothetical protein